MNRRPLLAFALGASLLGLAGCGPAPTAGTPSSRTNASAAPPHPPATPGTPTAQPKVPVGMVLIAAGRFVMGDKAEMDAPLHEVSVSAFYMDRHLVTQEQFQSVTGENPSRWKHPQHPVEQVRWSDAVRYCNRRSELEGLQPCYDLQNWQCNFAANGYRLPTEAEWEYACRAGTTTAYYFGDDPTPLREYAWFDQNAGGHPRPVGQKKPNPWGLHDMTGNVWEWCNDFYQVEAYAKAPTHDPRGPETGDTKVLRGGAWRFSADNCRSGYRYNEKPGYADVCFGYDIYGFRCVRAAAATQPAAATPHPPARPAEHP